MMGARPFGEGLQAWLQRSPLFNIEKVEAPLLVNAGRLGLITMWAPYAALRYLHKPVDLIVLNSEDEHVLTNPTVRLASQGGMVDWFRFWLQDCEDPAPAKAEQYRRWEGLRVLRDRNAASQAAGTVRN